MAGLVVQDGSLAGHRLEVASEVLIGRENAALLLDDPEVSRRHAVIRPRGDGLEIEDLGSLNGTWVNGHRVTQTTPLAAGDSVRVGATTIAVELAAPPVPMEPAASRPATAGPAPPAQLPRHHAPPEQAFQPPPQPVRRRGAATRGIVAIVVTFATIAATAILLVVYFATRTPPS